MEFEIIVNADVTWQFTPRGEIEITQVVPKTFDKNTQCYAAVTLSATESKALLYAYAKAGILEELTEEIAENNNYEEFLKNRYYDMREAENREKFYL
jgi:hypothetical protein